MRVADIELPDPDELVEIRGKAFTRRVALTTAIFAVMLAITSLGGNNAMKEMLLAQQQSSDQWAFYQSKVMREHMYKLQKLQFETVLLERKKTLSPDLQQYYDDAVKKLDAEENRYRKEKKAIEADAKRLEAERDLNKNRDPYFDYAEVLIQIAIVLASISILAASPLIFSVAVFSALCGSLLSLNGFLLLVRIPFFH